MNQAIFSATGEAENLVPDAEPALYGSWLSVGQRQPSKAIRHHTEKRDFSLNLVPLGLRPFGESRATPWWGFGGNAPINFSRAC
jgi:hypothetical protein